MSIIFSCNKKKIEEDPNVFYTCSMDPQVMEKKPGNCPICKMELTRTIVSEHQEKEGIRLSETQMKLGNIKTQMVGSGSIGATLSLRGTVRRNENAVTVISSRVAGRIDRLYIKNKGEIIHKGDRVYDLYSEELQAAIKQYLLLKDKSRQLNDNSINYTAMLKSAKNKLIIWGISENQIPTLTLQNADGLVPFYSQVNGVAEDILLSEGNYVNEGTTIINVADHTTLWVEAEAYPQDMSRIKIGSTVQVVIEAYPTEVIDGKIVFENPALEEQSRINLFRIEILNKEGKYMPGMQASITALLTKNTVVTIPQEAILYQPKRNTIWVLNKDGAFIPKIVETGSSNNGLVEIKSGLQEGELVVVSGVYLIDSEYRLRMGPGNMPGMNHENKQKESETPIHQH